MTKTALVTGGSSGIGYTYVSTLVKLGWNVAIVDLKGVQEAIASLSKTHGEDIKKHLLGLPTDISNIPQFIQALQTTTKHFGPLDLLVNNAGVFNLFFENIEKTLAVNLLAPIKATEWFIKSATNALSHPSAVPRNIIFTGSTNGLLPADPDVASGYVASKFGVVGFVRSLKWMGPKFGVRLNVICPATVDTPMNVLDAETIKFLEAEGRGGVINPQDCADAMVKILNDSSISGEVITVHPSLGFKVEPLDNNHQYDYLGLWSFHKSQAVDKYMEEIITTRLKGGKEGWSKL